ncbi:MAG: cytidylate kinase-like family protein, partial [Desulfobacteraceae bacterium]|nr:cytidylate kinase-like family protein [Desulfobacteraceae bacterium]
MKKNIGGEEFLPGIYAKKKPGAAVLADNYIREWEERWRSTKEKEPRPEMRPTICFSRKMGVGALEVADILAEKIGCRVIDREILEYIANQADLSEKT